MDVSDFWGIFFGLKFMLEFFKDQPEILAVMSERRDGSMKLLQNSDLNLENRKNFFQKFNLIGGKIVSAEIVHGKAVEIVNGKSPELIFGADGLVTKDKKVFLTVTVADCIPVYFWEPAQKIVAVVHCGWRGILSGVIENALVKIVALGGQPEKLKVALGPGLNACHFEIKEDVLGEFSKHPEAISNRGGKIFVDLKSILRKQLLALGVETQSITSDNTCTFENENYFSFRRDKSVTVEAMVAIIGLK